MALIEMLHQRAAFLIPHFQHAGASKLQSIVGAMVFLGKHCLIHCNLRSAELMLKIWAQGSSWSMEHGSAQYGSHYSPSYKLVALQSLQSTNSPDIEPTNPIRPKGKPFSPFLATSTTEAISSSSRAERKFKLERMFQKLEGRREAISLYL
jgi:hypothetical protein